MLSQFVGYCLTGAAGAQEAPCQRRSIPVALRDNQNLPFQDISVAELEAKVRGKPVKILSFAPDPRPHRLVLLLDTSGSMGSTAGESPLFALGLALARHFFEVHQQWSHIGLLTFNKNVTEALDFMKGNSAVGEKLQEIASDRNYVKANVKGTTALRDTILEGLQLLDHPSSADALYLLTDGGDNASKHSAADVTHRLALTSVGCLLYFFAKKRAIGIALLRNCPVRTNFPRLPGSPAVKSSPQLPGTVTKSL